MTLFERLQIRYAKMSRMDKIIAHLHAIHGQTKLVEYLGGDPVFRRVGFYTFIPF